MDALVSKIGTLEFYLDATILVALVGVVWTFARRAGRELYFLLSLRTRKIELVLEPKPDVPDNIKSLNLLFVRYGNDTYLSTLASDQERHHGRLRNKIICITRSRKHIGRTLVVSLRVHKRLGTQFKFFLEVEGDPEPALAYLNAHDTISDVSCAERPMLNSGEVKRYRIFFLVDRLAKEKTVEGFINNFVYPV